MAASDGQFRANALLQTPIVLPVSENQAKEKHANLRVVVLIRVYPRQSAVRGLGFTQCLSLSVAKPRKDTGAGAGATRLRQDILPGMSDKPRCPWGTTPAMIAYHDTEWGFPQHDDQVLFEFLILEGAQAGLSWSTILAKREAYRKAFSGFDPEKVARFNAEKIKRLMNDPGIVRNRLKIESAVNNAKATVVAQKEFGSFDRYIWQFVGGAPIKNSWRSMKNLPAETKESQAMSKDLKRRGFNFVGPTVCYAFMQAVGMVNDHVVSCFRYLEVGRKS
jgi:DNA-3-methyladenine glycosylase I